MEDTIEISTSNTGIEVEAEEKATEETQEQSTQEEQQDTTEKQETTNVQQLADDRKQVESDLKNDLESKGVDFSAIEKEYAENESLSKETLEQLEKAGYPKSVIDNYIKGLEADTQAFVQEVLGYAGGEDGYKQLASFIQSKGQQEIDNYQRIIATGDLHIIKMAIKGYQSELKATYGTTNTTYLGGSAGVTGNNAGFTSRGEMVEAMQDKRYGRDKAYTRSVENKVKNSTGIF